MKLSFCIPTYNRADYIGNALRSILAQITDEVEIVIVDGASTDRTEEVVRGYQAQCPRLRYYRMDKNRGVDYDLLKVVALAQGEYCWLMSDDDLIESGGLGYVLSQLSRYPGIAGASLNNAAYDCEMAYRIRTVPAAGRKQFVNDYLFHDRDRCFSVLGLHFGYLSCQVIKKSLWDKVVASEADLTPYFNCWLIVYMIGRILALDPRWLYIHRMCVSHRSGNDSFVARVGTYNRELITHVAFEKIVRDLFGKDSPVYREVFYTLLADRMSRTLAKLKAMGADRTLQRQLFNLYTKQYRYFPLYWLKVVPVFFVPNSVLRFIRYLYFLTCRIRERYNQRVCK